MPDANNNDLDAMLLKLAATAARRPTSRARAVRLCQAALAVLGASQVQPDADAPAHEPKTQHAFALREISQSLGMAAEHAAFLAAECEAAITRPPPS